MKRYVYAIIVWLLIAIAVNAGISLDHVDGSPHPYYILPDQPIVFYLRLTNDAGWPIAVINNGFRVYSPDGAVWNPITFDTTNIGWNQILDDISLSYFSVDGSGADTVGFSGLGIGTGIPVDFDSIAFIISTQVDSNQIGKTLCLDSSFFPPANHWLWGDGETNSIEPSWDGPHCFEVADCFTRCGDINGDSYVDFEDVVYFINYILFFSGFPPTCMANANVDGCNGVNIGDADYLMQSLFGIYGPDPCPEDPDCDINSSCSITLDQIDGPYVAGTNIIVADGVSTITFYLRVTGDENKHGAIANGFQIYSPDGAEWGGMVGDTIFSGMDTLFDMVSAINYFGVTGSDADTVGFGGIRMVLNGLPEFFDEQFYSITIGPIDPVHTGKTIVLDSCFFPPAGDWGFFNYYHPSTHPAWDGPHVFTLVESCCVPPMRGNIDYSPDNEINISDLVYFVNWSFGDPPGPAPPCPEEADVDGNSTIDIADIVYLVEYMFWYGPAPVACS